MTRFDHNRSPASIIGEFCKAMMDAGITPPEKIIADGKMHSFSTNEKESDDAGRYILDLNGSPMGWFRGHRTGIEKSWQLYTGRTLSDEEEDAWWVQADKIHQMRDLDDMKYKVVATAKSINIWKAAVPVKAAPPYSVREQVVSTGTLREISAKNAARILGYLPRSNGEPLQGHLIVVRVLVNGRISTLELIDANGRKSTVVDGAVERVCAPEDYF